MSKISDDQMSRIEDDGTRLVAKIVDGCDGCYFLRRDDDCTAIHPSRCYRGLRDDRQDIIWVRADTQPAPAEADPTGKAASEPGAKLDAGKPHADLVLDGFGLALLEVAKVATMGAQKYTADGWQKVPDGEARYRRAGDRHRLYRGTETHDPESKLLHLAHEAWNRLAELELLLRGGK